MRRLLACRGWANVGYHRTKPTPEVVTPAIDTIVAEGIALDRMYAYPYCAPSRAALISGRLPHHVSSGNIRGATYDGNHSEIGGQGVPRNMTTLSQMLAHAGYWSAFAGLTLELPAFRLASARVAHCVLLVIVMPDLSTVRCMRPGKWDCGFVSLLHCTYRSCI